MFAEIAPRIAELGSKCLPLHIGDTYRLPPEFARLSLQRAVKDASTRYYHYTHPFGRRALLEAIAEKLERENHIGVGPEGLQVTCGATQALATVAQSYLDPGDEVIVLCPHWPLIQGIVLTVGGVLVEADYTQAVASPEATLGPLVNERTRAIYFANPNNPDGRQLTEEEAKGLHHFALTRGIALWSDEAYEHILLDASKHYSIQALDAGIDKPLTVSIFTFSKSFAMAGMRVGYLAASPELMVSMRRVCNHQIYNLSDLAQEAALAALTAPIDEYRAYLNEQAQAYRQARDLLASALPCVTVPSAGAYLWVNCVSAPAARHTLFSWLDRGVTSAPGEVFGTKFAHCLRLCFTSLPLERLKEAVEIIAQVGIHPA